jgi:hypothetical protein
MAAVGLLGALPACGAMAAVSLILTDNDGTPQATTINKTTTTTFNVTVNLNSTSTATGDTASGVDYFLQIAGPAGGTSGQFKITTRSVTSSAFPDTFKSDATVATSPDNLLNPQDANDLGGVVNSPSATTNTTGGPVANGTFNVANYTLTIDPQTPNGVYTLSTFSNPGTGYQGPAANGFADAQFSAQGTFTVTVTPEPSSAMLLGAGVLGMALRRRRRA